MSKPRSPDDLVRWLAGKCRVPAGAAYLDTLAPLLQKSGIHVERGTAEAVGWLNRRGGEADTLAFEGALTLLFRDFEPSLSAVLEELAHVSQGMAQRFVDCDVREMTCRREIEAKQCLVDQCATFGVPPAEDAVTRQQLADEHAALRAILEQRS